MQLKTIDKLQEALDNLNHSDGEQRELAIDTVGTLNPDNAFEIIEPFLSDPDPEVRGTAACNLGEISDERAIASLINTVKHEQEEKVRAEALSALENYSAPEIFECLLNEVERTKKSRRPRQIVARQLSKYNSEKSVDALVILLEDEDDYVRIFAVDSLLGFNRPRLHQTWEKVLNDEIDYVSDIAAQALFELNLSTSPINRYQLSQSESNSIWDEAIDSQATSYFTLPNENWLKKGEQTSLGDWSTAFSNNERESVIQALEKTFKWDQGTVIQYFVKRNIVFQVTWKDFIQHWEDFLSAEYGYPIVMSQGTNQPDALLFHPIGKITKISDIQSSRNALDAVQIGLDL
ncbi:MAG: DUF2947 family protein [Cyanobacteria bacterium P01_F01_bin.150]